MAMQINIVRDNEIQCETDATWDSTFRESILRQVVIPEQNQGFRFLGMYLCFSSTSWEPQRFDGNIVKRKTGKRGAMKTMKYAMKATKKPMKTMKKSDQKAMKGKPMKAMKGKPMKAMKKGKAMKAMKKGKAMKAMK
eukprot:s3938_g8.t1